MRRTRQKQERNTRHAFVRNTWYVAAWSHDVGEPKPFAARILGERIVLFRSEAGRAAALEDRCVHRLAPLSLGRREEAGLRCMCHGILFNAQGRAIEIPGQEAIPAQARVRTHPVAERHGWVWVWSNVRRLSVSIRCEMR